MKHFIASAAQRLWLLLLAAVLTGTLATSCTKNDDLVDYGPIDDALIQKYIAANAITTAQKQPSGLYFVPVVTNASAPLATVGQVVSILYTGMLLDGTVFDASAKRGNYALSFRLGTDRLQVAGIEQGVSLMHKGDKAVLLIPSGLAYGPGGATSASSATPSVPANAVLRFEVELTDINPSYAVPDDTIIKKYLADKNITNAQKTASGLYLVPVLTNPSGAPAVAGKTAAVLYTGTLIDGTIFDSSAKNSNKPFEFVVGAGRVIAGWDEGIALLRKGEKAQLLIPSALAYGANGAAPSIRPNTVIRFDIEIADVR